MMKRNEDPSFSFKTISNQFLLKGGADIKISDHLLEDCLNDHFRGNTISRRVSDMILSMAKEIKEYRDAAKPKEEWPDKIHESHKAVRSSDASTFDFICDDCGATDDVTGGWGTLRKPCKGAR